MLVEVVPSEMLAGRAAIWVAERLWSAVVARGEAHLAVSGGSTPLAMLESLAVLPLPWSQIHVWQVDERVAPDGDPSRNAGQLASLMSVGAMVHTMPVTAASLADAAVAYADALPLRLDVIHLGLGDDGHTASWPPGDPVAHAASPVAVVGPFNGQMRLTLTPLVVNAARSVVFLVAGAAKGPVLERLLVSDPTIPASIVRRSGTVILTDVG